MDLIELLIDYGANIDAEDEEGYSPLRRVACTNGSFHVVKLLLSKGAYIPASLLVNHLNHKLNSLF